MRQTVSTFSRGKPRATNLADDGARLILPTLIMRLESARELKLELQSLVQAEVTVSARALSAYGMPARRVGDVERPFASLALGVAPAGKRKYLLAVRVQRRGLLGSAHLDAIRERARNEVDVRFIGRVAKRSSEWFRARHRPLRIGTSIGHYEVTAGTLGCFVRKGGSDGLVLSNNHVLADENRGRRGDSILQPGRFDGGRPSDTVGVLSDFVRLRRRGANRVDCALCKLAAGIEYEPAALYRGRPLQGVAPEPPAELEVVEKLGRTTGKTRGRVTAFEIDDVVINYDSGDLRFDNLIEIEPTTSTPFSEGGDSGSLIYTAKDRLARALLFAGSEQGGRSGHGLTYANPFRDVLDSLGVELLL